MQHNLGVAKDKFPVTAAIRALRASGVHFVPFLYEYEERGGTAASAAALGVDEHTVVKTLVLEDEGRRPLVCLMHGDRQVSTKRLARHLGARAITPCQPATAEKQSGYQVGGTSPFGLRHVMPVYMERSILDLEKIYINGGKRGFLVQISPRDALRVLRAEAVDVCTL